MNQTSQSFNQNGGSLLGQPQQASNAGGSSQLQDIIKDEILAQSNEERQELDEQKLKMLISIMKLMMNPNS
jgi:hypothetical protein